MEKWIGATLLSISILTGTNMACAADASKGSFSLGFGAGTLGYTIEPGYSINESFGLRAPIGAGSYSFEEDSDGEVYRGTVESTGGGLLLDYRTGLAGLKVSGGVFYTDYDISATASGINVGGVTTDLSVDIRQNENFSPVFSLGYEQPLFGKVYLTGDIGAILGNGFSVAGSSSSILLTNDQIENKIVDIRKNFEDLDVVPFVNLGVSFRF